MQNLTDTLLIDDGFSRLTVFEYVALRSAYVEYDNYHGGYDLTRKVYPKLVLVGEWLKPLCAL